MQRPATTRRGSQNWKPAASCGGGAGASHPICGRAAREPKPTRSPSCWVIATTGDDVLGQLGARPPRVQQPLSPAVERWIAEDATVVAWTLTAVELVSALRRLLREGALVEQAAREAEELARDLIARAHIVSDV